MTTTDDNLAIVRRAFTAFDRHDAALMREIIAADHVEHLQWEQPLPLPGDDTQPLLERYEQADANAWLDFPEIRTSIDEQFACGDRVATVWTAEATRAGTGQQVTIRGITIDRLAGGKIVETWASMDRLGVFQQLGVIESSRELASRAGLTA